MTIRLNPSNLGQTRSDLGLGTAATVNTGTTNATIPLLNANGRLDAARLGSGTADATTFLRGDGSFAAAGGAWSVKTSGTFSSTTALEVTNITKTTIVYYTAISQTQNSVGLRTSSNNGTSYDSTAGNYNQYGAYSTNSSLSNAAFVGSFTSMFVQGNNAPDAAGFLAGWFMLVQPADTNTKTIVLSMCCSEDAGTTGQQFYNMAGVRNTAAAVNAIKMFHPGVTSSFTSGSFVVCELN